MGDAVQLSGWTRIGGCSRPVARASYRWQRLNSRLAGGFGFERPGIRGLAKMRLRVTMALTIMLEMALGRIRAGQPEHLRSLVRPA